MKNMRAQKEALRHHMPTIGGVTMILIGLGVVSSFIVSGANAFAFGWKAVLGGCIAGLCLVWSGIRIVRCKTR